MAQTLRMVASTVLLVTLAACGGGGGGGSVASSPSGSVTPAQLNASNQTIVSQDMASSFNTFTGIQSALGAATTNESALMAAALSHLANLNTYMADARANALASGANTSLSYACQNSGNFSVLTGDIDNSGTVTSGDTFAISFNNCGLIGGPLDGGISFSFNTISGTYGTFPYSFNVQMNIHNLSTRSTLLTATINGDTTLDSSQTSAVAFTHHFSSSALSSNVDYNGSIRTRNLSNYILNEVRVADPTYSYIDSITVQGKIDSSGWGGTQSVTLTTPAAMVRRGTNPYPYTGTLLATGVSNSALRLTTLSNTDVKVELDANGDGTFESVSATTWDKLI